MRDFHNILKGFLHDPIDKPFDIPTHEKRAKEYAGIFGISGIEEAKSSDQIASCMERSLLPKDIIQDFSEIRHPLSEGVIEKSKLPSKDFDFAKMKEIFKEMSDELRSSDDKKKIFYLWRNLQEKIVETVDSEWKKFIPLLPADTRIPDHSIWEHLKIASSVNAFENGQNNSLFLFTIGPVQSFISQARKTQDLYLGSFLLSYLTFIGITALMEKYGPTCIIYPDLFRQPLMDWYLEKKERISVENSSLNFLKIPTLPNRFVAIISETDEGEIKKIGDNISKRVREEWQRIGNSILDDLKAKNIKDLELEEVVQEKFKSQISDFPEIYWTAVPWRIDNRDLTITDLNPVMEEKEIKKFAELWAFASKHGEYPPNIGLLYGFIYTALEKSIGARKNLRDFKQFSVEEIGRKCSLCGERDVFVFHETKNKNKFKKYNSRAINIYKVSKGKIPPKYLAEGEGLCGICFIKRTLEIYLKQEVGFYNVSFPSTAEIACADFKERVLNKVKDLLEDYIKEFKEVLKNQFSQVKAIPLPKLKEKMKDIENIEGEYFYEENLTPEYFEKNLSLEENKVPLKNQLSELSKKLTKLTGEVGKPNPYYGVIMFDGDNMGKWLAGELLPEIKHAYHSEVWEKLGDPFKKELQQKLDTKLLTPALHASISTALRNYSLEWVRKIVEEEHLGKLVYVGGDEVLALVNLKDIFPVMRKLRAAFSGQIRMNNKGEIEVDWENETGFVEKNGRYSITMGKNATASMGVVIAHYKMPLKIVLDKAREMEKLAKNNLKKDSFAMGFFKHSGEAKITGYKWRYKDSNGYMDTIDGMIKLKKYFTKRENGAWLSKSFVYNLGNTFVKLKDEDARFPLVEGAFNSELKRLIKRQLMVVIKNKKNTRLKKCLIGSKKFSGNQKRI